MRRALYVCLSAALAAAPRPAPAQVASSDPFEPANTPLGATGAPAAVEQSRSPSKPSAAKPQLSSFFEAVKKGDFAEVRRALTEDPSLVNAKDERFGATPLHWAALRGHQAIVALLIAEGADPNATNDDSETALQVAERAKRKEILRLLRSPGPPNSSAGGDIFEAAKTGDVEAVRLLLAENPSLLNQADARFGATPLHWAALKGHEKVVKLLLDQGADPSLRNHDGETPVQVAGRASRSEAARLLRAAGGDTAPGIFEAAKSGDLARVQELAGADPAILHRKDAAFAATPLHWAALRGHVELVKFLVARGADLEARNKDGETPLKVAERAKRREVVALLKAGGGASQPPESPPALEVERSSARARVGSVAEEAARPPAGQPDSAPSEEKPALKNDDIVALVKAGLSPLVIKAKIAASACDFDTSAEALARLKGAEVPDEIVVAMLEASRGDAPRGERIRDELTSSFRRLQNSVFTVWSETGTGTGFVVDRRGLLLTNHHVVGPSEYIAVQFDQQRKIPALRLDSDPMKDLAVLWADLSAIPEVVVAPVSRRQPSVEEGERVFTIGSPLSQSKIITSGIASKVEASAIMSDVNINPGNSGGPLFNSFGEVIGVTTFGEFTRRGPGVSGVVRIEEAFSLLQRAVALLGARRPPHPEFLPVEPTKPFPLEAIKSAANLEKFDTRPYTFGLGDYDIGIMTPILMHRVDEGDREAAKSKQKRTKRSDESFDPTSDLYNWAEHTGKYRAVVTIRARPKVKETFWSSLGRSLAAASGSYYTGPANLKFKADFRRMVLRCGAQVVQPIHPGKIAHLINRDDPFVKLTDATYEGIYTYPSEAFDPACGEVSLTVYSEKDNEASTKKLDKKTVDRVWADFEGWRWSHRSMR